MPILAFMWFFGESSSLIWPWPKFRPWGWLWGLLIGFQPVITSILFTFLGATLFALVRIDDDRIPHEAFIGIVYAVASAGAILVVAKSPTGEASALQFSSGTSWP